MVYEAQFQKIGGVLNEKKLNKKIEVGQKSHLKGLTMAFH